MNLCSHCGTPLQGAHHAAFTLADTLALSGKSTATEVQEQRIVAALKTGPKTTDDLRALGIFQSSARVHGLRKRGYVIETQLFNGIGADGYSHARMARYTLKEEPLPLDARTAREAFQNGASDQNEGAACIS